MIRADMHIHTYCSDGTQSPGYVVSAAKAAGVNLICVTDHDTMGASGEVKRLAFKAGIRAFDGIEISAYGEVKVHILGYGLNRECAAFKSYYKEAVEGSVARCEDTLNRLRARDIVVPIDDVLAERTVENTPVHSMFICRAAAKLGYAKSAGEFYLTYLVDGKCAHSRVGRLTPEQAVQTINACGGWASVAHPGRIALEKSVKEELISRLKGLGLRGIEAVYSGHTVDETAYYKEIAERYSLLVTGGSDAHFAAGPRFIGTPEFYPDEKLLSALEKF